MQPTLAMTMAVGSLPSLARAPHCPSRQLTTGNFPLNRPRPLISLPASSSPKHIFISSTLQCRIYRFKPSRAALDSSDAQYHDRKGIEMKGNDGELKQWDSLTAKFAGAANLPFLLLQLPQIVLNSRNLTAGNKSALLAVPWLGIFTGLLGNLSLLSYFAKKKENEAILVQTLGVISMYVVIAQLALAEAMPWPYFVATSVVVASGLVLNFMNYFNWLNAGIWRLWEDFITVGGLSVLPQVMWSTFIPAVPNSILPGSVAFVLAIGAVALARMGKLSEKGVKFVGSISGWTATLLFMWMPVAQMWTSFLNPENIKGLSAISMLLAMIGNGLMIPRALFIRDFMWFTGATWASILYGWGSLVCMYWFNSIGSEFFFSATFALFAWLGITLWRDTKVHGYTSPFRSLKEPVSLVAAKNTVEPILLPHFLAKSACFGQPRNIPTILYDARPVASFSLDRT